MGIREIWRILSEGRRDPTAAVFETVEAVPPEPIADELQSAPRRLSAFTQSERSGGREPQKPRIDVRAFGWYEYTEDKRRVAVVVPVHNTSRLLYRTLDSVARQQYVPDEVIVVADACTDKEWRAIRALSDVFACRAVRTEFGNSGKARNHGMTFTSGELVYFPDGDGDTTSPNWLMKARHVMRDLRVGVCHVASSRAVGNRQGTFTPKTGGVWYQLPVPASSSYLFRRAAIEDVGGWDESEDNFARDATLVRQIVSAGWFVRAVPDTQSEWYRHPEAAGQQEEKTKKLFGKTLLRTHPLLIIGLLSNPVWAQRWVAALCRQAAKLTKDNVDILIVDDGPSVAATVIDKLRDVAQSVQVIASPLSQISEAGEGTRPTVAKCDRVGKLYRFALQHMPKRSKLILFWEQDVIPRREDDVYRLIEEYELGHAAVSGLVPTRWDPSQTSALVMSDSEKNELVRLGVHDIEETDGPLAIDCVGFGFLLVDASVFERIMWPPAACCGETYEFTFAQGLKVLGGQLVLNPNIRMNHG